MEPLNAVSPNAHKGKKSKFGRIPVVAQKTRHALSVKNFKHRKKDYEESYDEVE